MTEPHTGYSGKFRAEATAADYERCYDSGTSDEAIWDLERRFLLDLMQRDGRDWQQADYLDFACGTGRVIEFIEMHVGRSRGIDISPEMLRIAATKVTRSELLCSDIAASGPVEGSYDLITAFRFFLNAEPTLRLVVMKALARRLKNRTSLLVFTNHGNPLSYKAMLWPYHTLSRVGKRRPVVGNYMTHREVIELLNAGGLEMVERRGYGFVSPRLFGRLPAISQRLEATLAFAPAVSRLGVNQIYVARLAQ